MAAVTRSARTEQGSLAPLNSCYNFGFKTNQAQLDPVPSTYREHTEPLVWWKKGRKARQLDWSNDSRVTPAAKTSWAVCKTQVPGLSSLLTLRHKTRGHRSVYAAYRRKSVHDAHAAVTCCDGVHWLINKYGIGRRASWIVIRGGTEVVPEEQTSLTPFQICFIFAFLE